MGSTILKIIITQLQPNVLLYAINGNPASLLLGAAAGRWCLKDKSTHPQAHSDYTILRV